MANARSKHRPVLIDMGYLYNRCCSSVIRPLRFGVTYVRHIGLSIGDFNSEAQDSNHLLCDKKSKNGYAFPSDYEYQIRLHGRYILVHTTRVQTYSHYIVKAGHALRQAVITCIGFCSPSRSALHLGPASESTRRVHTDGLHGRTTVPLFVDNSTVAVPLSMPPASPSQS